MALQFTDEQRRIAQLLGIRDLNSQNDLDQIRSAKAAALVLGIQNIDSQNDIRQINAYYAEQDKEPEVSPESTTEVSPESTTEVSTEPVTSEENKPPTIDYDDLLGRLKISFQTKFDEQSATIERLGTEAREREEGYQTQLRTMGEQQRAAEQEFARQAAEQQQAFETAQRVSASNMARGGQQTDYRLGGAGVIRGGTAGFRRRLNQQCQRLARQGLRQTPPVKPKH